MKSTSHRPRRGPFLPLYHRTRQREREEIAAAAEGALQRTSKLVTAPLRMRKAPKFVIARLRRSRGNLAGCSRNMGRPPANSQLPSRDCRVALLLAMTHQAGAAAHQCPSAVELPCTRRSLSAAAFFSRTADLYGSPQPTEKYPKFGNKGQNCPFLCHKNMPYFTTCQALFF